MAISGVIGNRTRTLCKTRYEAIRRARLKNPDTFELITMKSSTLTQRRQDAVYDRLSERLAAFLRGESAAAPAGSNEPNLEANSDEAKETYTMADGVSSRNHMLIRFP